MPTSLFIFLSIPSLIYSQSGYYQGGGEDGDCGVFFRLNLYEDSTFCLNWNGGCKTHWSLFHRLTPGRLNKKQNEIILEIPNDTIYTP